MNTTISIPKDLREDLRGFGVKGETYADIIYKLVNSAKNRQLQDLLMNEKDTISVADALKEAKKKWSK